jgi:hypothetical protein
MRNRHTPMKAINATGNRWEPLAWREAATAGICQRLTIDSLTGRGLGGRVHFPTMNALAALQRRPAATSWNPRGEHP